MGVKREDMFGNGLVSMEYYPHKRIELRVDRLKIVVSKPYGIDNGGYTFKSPAIQISSNSTVTISFREINLINSAILRAIDILNAENDGILIDRCFEVNYNTIRLSDIPNKVKEIHMESTYNKVQYISNSAISNKGIYEDIRGHKWVYLGEGKILVDGNVHNRVSGDGRRHSKYIYLDYDRMCQYGWTQRGDIIQCKDVFIVDSYATKKKFISKVGELESHVRKVKTPYTELEFVPIAK